MADNRKVKSWGSFDSRLISLIVHELRNPLTAIKGYSDLLLQETAGGLSDTQSSFVRMINSNSVKMADLITMLSDISRLNEGKLNYSMAPLPLDGYVEKTVKKLEDMFRTTSFLFNKDEAGRMPRVMADPHRLGQILTHLLRNSIQYAKEKPSFARINFEEKPGYVQIRIVDQGIGIPEELQEHLFSPFFRVNDRSIAPVDGWGLGLYLSKSLIEGMGGEIGFESQANQGSTFWITLPAKSSD